ncbi:MAG TPA: sulfurtransferase TusA family protein [Rhizorhapis sp.]
MENKALRVDVRGMRCPWPVLRAARMLRDHTEILILADDPAAPGELRSFAQERGWRLAEERIGEGFAFHIWK